MKKTEIFTLGTPYREDLKITGYTFGQGQKSACIVGSIRGNEVQQLYVCSQIVRKLEELEAAGKITKDKEILVIPSINHHAMNIGKRSGLWTIRTLTGCFRDTIWERLARGSQQEYLKR